MIIFKKEEPEKEYFYNKKEIKKEKHKKNN